MSELKSMFNGCVLMSDSAINDPVIMKVLQSEQDNNFEFKSIDSSSYNISDRDWSFLDNIHSQIAVVCYHEGFTNRTPSFTLIPLCLTCS